MRCEDFERLERLQQAKIYYDDEVRVARVLLKEETVKLPGCGSERYLVRSLVESATQSYLASLEVASIIRDYQEEASRGLQ